MQNPKSNRAFSLMELMTVIVIVSVLAALIVPRLVGHNDSAKKSACNTNQRDIELQVRLWKRNAGTYPLANLSNIGGDANYFPSGLPVCPVDGSAYSIDTTTGLVIGHTH
jgi:prepilin-type N-terminal cleavage/methylation domain-containing protein